MCGIMAYTGAQDAKGIVFRALKKLEYRGYDSAGMAWTDGVTPSFEIVKRVGRVDGLADVAAGSDKAACAIGHTRWATHGEAVERNSHPHAFGKVCLVHNGIIENYRELAIELKEKYGTAYTAVSDTDSEVAAMLINACYQDDPLEALKLALPRLEGSFALAVIFEDHPAEIYCARYGSALLLSRTETEAAASSDILGTTLISPDYLKMPEKSMARLTAGKIELFDFQGKALCQDWKTVAWEQGDSQMQGFEFFMEKEIHEEPKAVRDTLLPRLREGELDFSAEGITPELFRSIREIVIVACGTAMHAGLVGKRWFEKTLRIPCRVEIGSEFRYSDPILSPETLLIAISQSGETADTIASFKLGRERGVPTLAIVNVRESAITEIADYVVYTNAGPEVAVASTKAYTVQLLALYMLNLYAARARHCLDEASYRKKLRELVEMPDILESLIRSTGDIDERTSAMVPQTSAFYIGRGLDCALAMEGSLKLKEITYIHSEAHAAGELKHGTISLIEDGIPCIALATQPELHAKMRSNIQEVKSRGACVYLIADPSFPHEHDLYAERFDIPQSDPELAPFYAAVYLQMIAFTVSRARGLDVDHPRNLAKSVTVE